ncbi:asparagine synthetase B family protein [Calidifontimicrobium sp. SYSU G02091]|uniref:asparagine synthetase B family protein n=1 Tax=Calidifontimicrobium sp. SYSU G02091 TaxID=2926421 RepID=UPI001F530F99|nr:asparagine synthase-related protein [Calidifontimicrobium sp. SYSU G02091]MCI1193138.1 asparagine synthetase B family protein [Calidifontimicrobium sp. SYSU G02091]
MQVAPQCFAAAISVGRSQASPDNAKAPETWFAGHLLNADALRRSLALDRDAPLESLVRSAWQRWSLALATRLEGVFTLAILDRGELYLYRDPSGFRDLYLRQIGSDRFAFATDLDGLRRVSPRPLEPSRHALHEYLRFLDIAAPNAWYAGVQAVEPGQWVRCSARGVESGLREETAALATPVVDFDDAVDALEQHLQRSVGQCLEASQSPAAFLSGGVDSALLCAVAGRQRADLTAVTVGFEGAAFDEAPVAQKIASHLGLTHQVLRFSHADDVAAFERLVRQMDQPMADPATPATLLSFEHCRTRFDTVLDGSGVEDAIGFYPPRHMRIAVAYAALLPAAVRRALTRWLQRVPPLAGYTPLVDFEHPAETMIRWKGFTAREIEALCGEPASLEHTQFYRTFERFPRHAHVERYSAVMACLPSERLTQCERITGLPIRYPFCDRAVFDFLRALPVQYRHTPTESKRVLRALLARHVPRPLWDLPKHGFNFPLQRFLAADDHALVRRYVMRGRWLERGLMRADEVRRYAQQYVAGDERLMFRVWALVVLGAWLDAHEDLIIPASGA